IVPPSPRIACICSVRNSSGMVNLLWLLVRQVCRTQVNDLDLHFAGRWHLIGSPGDCEDEGVSLGDEARIKNVNVLDVLRDAGRRAAVRDVDVLVLCATDAELNAMVGRVEAGNRRADPDSCR